MKDIEAAGDAVRPRLQLSLGIIAELGREMSIASERRTFAAVSRGNGQRAIVTLHARPPRGPESSAVQHRLAQLRDLQHGTLNLPLAYGDLDGCAWVVEAVSAQPCAADRLAQGSMPVSEAVSAIRDLARAVSAMHRCGIAHGAIALDTVTIGPDGARLGGTGLAFNGSQQGDLDALGQVAWSLLSGEVHESSSRPLLQLRRGVPLRLDALCRAWLSTDPALRPQRAEAVLDVLDAIPTRRPRAADGIVDVSGHDGRPRLGMPWLLLGGAALVLIVLLALRG